MIEVSKRDQQRAEQVIGKVQMCTIKQLEAVANILVAVEPESAEKLYRELESALNERMVPEVGSPL